MTKTTPTTSVGLKLVLDPLWLMESVRDALLNLSIVNR